MIDRAKILAKKYFDSKGYKNAEIDIMQRDDVTAKNKVILDVTVDKKEKMKVRNIIIEGNENLPASKMSRARSSQRVPSARCTRPASCRTCSRPRSSPTSATRKPRPPLSTSITSWATAI